MSAKKADHDMEEEDKKKRCGKAVYTVYRAPNLFISSVSTWAINDVPTSCTAVHVGIFIM